MLRFILKRLTWLVLVLFGLSVITFILSRVIPGDPAALYLGPRPKPEQVEIVRSQLGLDKPLTTQFIYYLRDLSQGDLGTSLRTHRPVMVGIMNHLPATLELMVSAIVMTLLIGIPIGVISAKKENTFIDHFYRFFSIAGTSLPPFWLAMMLQIVFFRWLNIFPIGGRFDTIVGLLNPVENITGFLVVDALLTGNWAALKDGVWHLILPSMTLAAYPTGLVARMTRSTMLEVLREDYITTARSIGVSENEILFLQGLRNALAPILTVAGLSFAYLLIGAFYIELIFFWPGIGKYIVTAIQLNDYPVVMGVTLLLGLFYVSINLFVDTLIAIVDPRIRIKS